MPARAGSAEGLLLGWRLPGSPCCPHIGGKRVSKLSGVPLIRMPIPFMKVPLHDLIYSPKSPPPNAITWGLDFRLRLLVGHRQAVRSAASEEMLRPFRASGGRSSHSLPLLMIDWFVQIYPLQSYLIKFCIYKKFCI